MINNKTVKVAILDLYNGISNQAIQAFVDILVLYKANHKLDMVWSIFDVRAKNELPDLSFDLYISSGGPGSPFSADEEWDKSYFNLIDRLKAFNNEEGNTHKKHVLFICHSFQLFCRQYGLGEVCLRDIPSFGIVPARVAPGGAADPIFKNLPDPFYAVDSRSWQVVRPDLAAFVKAGASLLALEQARAGGLPPALMAIRFNDYFIGTQFHPEAGPAMMGERLLMADNKQQVVAEIGLAGYAEMLKCLNDPDRLWLTFDRIIPAFLDEAIK